MFIDVARITVQSGKGGDGAVSFRREKFVPKGGPDGGNGGRGGDVVVVGNPHLNTLLDFRFKRKFASENGKNGMNSRKSGKNAKKLLIHVPLGTVVKDVNTGEVVADIQTIYQEVVIAKGGDGGRGNSEFKSPTNQTPRYAEKGFPGEERVLELELKLLADVGLVGFPNVGKSTLISVLSAAKPKIADYPFTTLVPNLGMVRIADEQSYCIADIPGLIEGAHEGKGLGAQFLRHVERTRVLVFLLDGVTHELPPKEQYTILCNELEQHNPLIAQRKRVICLSKADGIIDEEERQQLVQEMQETEPDVPVLLLSSVAGENVEELKLLLWNIVKSIQKEEIVVEHKILLVPDVTSDADEDDIYDEDDEYFDEEWEEEEGEDA